MDKYGHICISYLGTRQVPKEHQYHHVSDEEEKLLKQESTRLKKALLNSNHAEQLECSILANSMESDSLSLEIKFENERQISIYTLGGSNESLVYSPKEINSSTKYIKTPLKGIKSPFIASIIVKENQKQDLQDIEIYLKDVYYSTSSE